MNRELTASPGFSLTQPSLLRKALVVVLGSLFVAICAHLSVPLWFTPVPLTLQNFGVLLLGLILAPELSACALTLYLIEGAAGLPVFAPGGAVTFLHLFGPTGGYLVAYPFAGWLIGQIRRRMAGGFSAGIVAAAVGDALVLIAGSAWLGLWLHQSATAAFAMGAAPFIAGDTLKVLAAAGVAAGFRRFARK